jgi:hypothetical protein
MYIHILSCLFGKVLTRNDQARPYGECNHVHAVLNARLPRRSAQIMMSHTFAHLTLNSEL